MLTKEKEIQAFIWHVLIDQHFLIPFNTGTQQPDKIPVLEFGDEYRLISELLEPLSRSF